MTSTPPSPAASDDARDLTAAGYDPRAALADCLDSWGSGSWTEANAAANLDEVMAHVERLLAAAAPPAHPVQAHIEQISAEAYLNVMGHILTIVVDREQVSDTALLALTADDVTEMYDSFVSPAVDRVEADLLDRG